MKSFAIVVLSSCLTIACAGARDASRVEPLLFLPHQREIALPIRSSERPAATSISATCDRATRGRGRCGHVSVRLDTVLAVSTATVDERNRIIALLLGVSDYNCSAFTAQAFGRKAQLQTANTIVTSVSRALAARSEEKSSLFTMLKLVDETVPGVLGHSSAAGSAESAVEIAISDERSKRREEIKKRAVEQVQTYTLHDALSDLTAYDGTCSLQRGKELALQAAALAAREEAERVLKVISGQAAPAPQ